MALAATLPLHTEAWHLSRLQSYKKNGADLRISRDCHGRTPIFIALEEMNIPFLRAILRVEQGEEWAMRLLRKIPPFDDNGALLKRSLVIQQQRAAMSHRLKEYQHIRDKQAKLEAEQRKKEEKMRKKEEAKNRVAHGRRGTVVAADIAKLQSIHSNGGKGSSPDGKHKEDPEKESAKGKSPNGKKLPEKSNIGSSPNVRKALIQSVKTQDQKKGDAFQDEIRECTF